MNIKLVEEIALKMYPSTEQITLDGWLLRLYKQNSHQSNTINPLYSGRMDIFTKIRECESIFTNRGFQFVYRLTPFSQPSIDDILDKLGYTRFDESRMLYLDLKKSIPVKSNTSNIQLTDPEKWMDVFQIITDYSDTQKQVYYDVIHSIAHPKCFMINKQPDGYASCGLGILVNNIFGIFSINTQTQFQNKGFATELIIHMLDWAQSNNASNVCLHVKATNLRALYLYQNIGFYEAYSFWYRSRPNAMLTFSG